MDTFSVSIPGFGHPIVKARGFVDPLERVLPADDHPRLWGAFGIDRATPAVAAEWDVGEARNHRVRVELRPQAASTARIRSAA